MNKRGMFFKKVYQQWMVQNHNEKKSKKIKVTRIMSIKMGASQPHWIYFQLLTGETEVGSGIF